jgi:glucokinase
VRTAIQNDANACALAEWKFGAGRGTKNMAFLTFGTSLGAGLIINGALYSGTNDNAGELGHIRLSKFGPVGYGKIGSFEGFASGGGITQLAKMFLLEKFQKGESVEWCKPEDINTVTAKMIAEAANAGDELAIKIYKVSAEYLGLGSSILIDILNPEMIVIGSIFTRSEHLIRPYMQKIINEEALFYSNQVCKIMPAALGEKTGDYAALSVASNLIV